MNNCLKCPHALHIGTCLMGTVIQGIETDCLCVIPTAESLDKAELKQRDLQHRKDIMLLQLRKWK